MRTPRPRRARAQRTLTRGVVEIRINAHPHDAAAVISSIVERCVRPGKPGDFRILEQSGPYGNEDGRTGRIYLKLLLPIAYASQDPPDRKAIGDV